MTLGIFFFFGKGCGRGRAAAVRYRGQSLAVDFSRYYRRREFFFPFFYFLFWDCPTLLSKGHIYNTDRKI